MTVRNRAAVFTWCLLLALFAAPHFRAAGLDSPAVEPVSQTAGPDSQAVEPVSQTVEPENQVVRVGWYEPPFNITDQFGRRSGYAYEYQQKIAAYAGWSYAYVYGSWPELYLMLLDGQLDLMSDISYTEERAEKMLFSSLPMGSEAYYACISADNASGVTAEDFASFNGKRIGVNKGSFQESLTLEWMERNGIQAEIVELMTDEAESIAMLKRGELDAYICVDGYGVIEGMIPVCKIGSSDSYFAVNKDRPDLLRALDSAMNRIQDENRNYNQRIQEKYFSSTVRTRKCTGTSAFSREMARQCHKRAE